MRRNTACKERLMAVMSVYRESTEQESQNEQMEQAKEKPEQNF